MTAYYNEIDPYAAQWLRNLIAAGHIAPGEVDERSIVDVQADDLKGFTQCHFFAGIGGWSLALRLAGWSDDRPIWTGSCPCQPFSSTAFKSTGQQDERHLWPHFDRLIGECKPAEVFGEQVDEAIAYGWIDDAFFDLEEKGYACATVVLPAIGVGASFEGQRLYFIAAASSDRQPGSRPYRKPLNNEESGFGEAGSLVNAFQRNALPFVCARHDGLPRNMASGILRGAGNAIVPQVAAEVISAYMDLRAAA